MSEEVLFLVCISLCLWVLNSSL